MLALYAAAAVLHVRAFRAGSDAPGHARWFTGVGIAVHAGSLTALAASGVVPGFAEFVSGVALALMVVVALSSRGRLGTLGAFLAPVAASLVGIAFVAPSAHVAALDQVEGGWYLPVHIGLMAVAVVALFVEFAAALVRMAVRRRLKAKDLDAIGRLPALEVLDAVQFRSLVLGLATLGLGVVIGALWAASTMHHQSWIANPKVWTTAVVWAWYAGGLQARLTLGWHWRWSAWISAVGFAALMFVFLGLDFVVGGFHGYGG